MNPNTPIQTITCCTVGFSSCAANLPLITWRNEMRTKPTKNRKENEIATAIKAGAVEGGADKI